MDFLTNVLRSSFATSQDVVSTIIEQNYVKPGIKILLSKESKPSYIN